MIIRMDAEGVLLFTISWTISLWSSTCRPMRKKVAFTWYLSNTSRISPVCSQGPSSKVRAILLYRLSPLQMAGTYTPEQTINEEPIRINAERNKTNLVKIRKLFCKPSHQSTHRGARPGTAGKNKIGHMYFTFDIFLRYLFSMLIGKWKWTDSNIY